MGARPVLIHELAEMYDESDIGFTVHTCKI